MTDLNAPAPRSRFGGHAALVGAGILLSRISGLVREKVFAHYFGNSDAAGVFKAAIRIPNFLQNLFGEGVLSASFIPVYAKLLVTEGEEVAGRVAGIVASLLALATAVLVLIGMLVTPYILVVIAPGFHGEVRQLTITVVRILFPGIGLLVMSAWCLGILNSHRRFFLSYAAPVLMNIAMIATLLVFGRRVNDAGLAVAAGWGTVVGAALQFGIQLPAVFRYGKHLRFAIDTTLQPVRDVIGNFGAVFIGRGVVQLSGYLDNLLASLLGTAAVSGLAYAQMIYFLPVSLFGMSVAAAELPQMSSLSGDEATILEALRVRLLRGLRQIAFFVIPSAVAFIAIGRVLIAALYEGGRFGPGDTMFVWYTLVGSTVGLLAVTLGRLYSNAFYALGDPKTPLRFAVLRVILTGVLGYLFAIPLRPAMLSLLRAANIPLPLVNGSDVPLGVIGLTASAGLAGWLEFWMLRRALARRTGAVRLPVGYLARLWLAAVIGGGIAIAISLFGRDVMTRLPLHRIATAAIVATVFGLTYLGATLALGVPEAGATVRRFRGR